MNIESVDCEKEVLATFVHPVGEVTPFGFLVFTQCLSMGLISREKLIEGVLSVVLIGALGLLALRIGRKISFERAEFRENTLVLSGLNKEFVFPYSEPLEITTELKFMDLHGWCVVVVDGRRYGLATGFKGDVEFLRTLCSHWPEHLPTLKRFIPPRSRSFPVKVLTDEDHLEDWKPSWYSEENPGKSPK